MAFRLADVKKTVRPRSDGQRYIHPKLLEGPAVSAQVGLALAYLHARLGRPRREVDPEMLVRFFGDPKVARGLVSCLRHTYRWRAQGLADVLEAKDLARLAARDIRTPTDLRLFLYDALNARGHGFLPAERDEHLRPLARRLGLTPAKLDQLVALDAEENAVLVRVGPVPEPEHVVARGCTISPMPSGAMHARACAWPGHCTRLVQPCRPCLRAGGHRCHCRARR